MDPTDSISFVIGGNPSVLVTVTENSNGTLTFDLRVDGGDTGMTADLRGLFFDVAVENPEDLSVSGGDELTTYDTDDVTNLGGGNNVNGLAEDGGFDVGISFGTSGIGKDDIQTTSFTLTYPGGLTLADLSGMDFATRLTSVGEEDGSRDGSLKLAGEAPLIQPDPDGEDDGTGGQGDDDVPPEDWTGGHGDEDLLFPPLEPEPIMDEEFSGQGDDIPEQDFLVI